jgi:4-amino-4-deoxy-L-arabinose transferase-like glycosyltransferase
MASVQTHSVQAVRASARLPPWAAPAAVIALALIARGIVAVTIPHYRPLTDSADFDRWAVSLARHGSFPASALDPNGSPTALRPPAFPLALAALYKLVGTGDPARRWEAGLLLQAVLGAVSVALLYLIARRLWSRGIALACGLVAALWPPLVMVGTSLMAEPLFIALELAAVLAALHHRDSPCRWRWAIAAGVLCGLASLARSNGVVVVVALLFLVWTGRPRLTRAALRAPLALLAATILTIAPWTIRNALVLHHFVPITTEAGYALAGTYNPTVAGAKRFPAAWAPPVLQEFESLSKNRHIDEAALSNQMLSDGLTYVRHHPTYVAKVFYYNSLRTLDLTGTSFERFAARYEVYPRWLVDPSVYAIWVVLLLAAGALVTGAGGLVRRAPVALWWVPLLVFLSVVFVYGGARYRSPADPFLIALAVLALDALRRRARNLPLASARG